MVVVGMAKLGAGVIIAAPAAIVALLTRMHGSVGLAAPTGAMLAEENAAEACALFRHLPQLAEKLAWRSLGASVTPIHRCTLDTPSGAPVEFFVKREDLASSLYGGNKVRTLQHQLAVIESRLAQGDARCANIHVCGTGGSNQVVATAVHARHRLPEVTPVWLDKDKADLDNTLNMLSTLSMPLAGSYHWGEPLAMLRRLLGAAFGGDGVIVTMGGNCPAGVLGQVGGVLELAEQVAAGAMPPPDRIYLPLGSSCTAGGLIIGLALARHLGLGGLDSDSDGDGDGDGDGDDARGGRRVRIVGVPVHEALVLLQARLGLHTAWASQWVPFTLRHTLRTSCEELRALGGPDLLEPSLRILREEVDILTDAELVGTYGGHSERSRAAAAAYDATGRLYDYGGDGAAVVDAPPLWLCGHFVAKAFAPLLDDAASEELRGKTLLLWQTKSAVQPRGEQDEWAAMRAMPPSVRDWADDGSAESALRPGSVDTAGGAADDYRHLMTPLP